MTRILPLLFTVFMALTLLSCKDKSEQRDIRFVEPVAAQSGPVDSLMMELDELMQQYAATLSRSEQGESVESHLMAIQARITDFGLKLEMKMHDMSQEDIERFNKFYDECLERMGMAVPSTDTLDVAF